MLIVNEAQRTGMILLALAHDSGMVNKTCKNKWIDERKTCDVAEVATTTTTSTTTSITISSSSFGHFLSWKSQSGVPVADSAQNVLRIGAFRSQIGPI